MAGISGQERTNPPNTAASSHSSIKLGTKFQKEGLAASVVKAHAAVLEEFKVSPPGAAQLTREGAWFMLEEAAVSRSIETVAVVATLIATFSFTAFLSPPGGWTPSGSAVALVATLSDGLAAPFMTFAVFNTVALAASMSLVLLIALGNSFGWKTQEMLWLLTTGFVLLALAALSAFAAFAAAARILSPTNTHLTTAVVAILFAAVLMTAGLLWGLLLAVKAEARHDAYRTRLEALASVLRHLLDTLRALNNSYITAEEVAVGDVVLGHYYHCYAVLMLATLMPLFRQFVKQVRELSATEIFWRQGIQEVEAVLKAVVVYWLMWLDPTGLKKWDHPGITWDAGIKQLGYCYKPVGATLPSVTGGIWLGHSARAGVACCFDALEATARGLVADLLATQSEAHHIKTYLGQVKCMFLWANLSPMMPDSVRAAIKEDFKSNPAEEQGQWWPVVQP